MVRPSRICAEPRNLPSPLSLGELLCRSGQSFSESGDNVRSHHSGMLVLGALWFLSTLAAPGHCLTCIECMSTNSTSCAGDAVTCPDGYVCGTSYMESTVGGLNSIRYIQSCTNQTLCNKTGSFSTLYGTTKMSTSCCLSDNCTATILPVPPVSSQRNGVTCPTCQSSSSDWCYNTQMVECSGEETICALYSTNINGNLSSIRGCAREGGCGSQNYNVNGTGISYQSTCYCGGNASNTYCPETNVTCPIGTICTTVHALTTIGDAYFERRTSICSPIYQCGVEGSTTFLKGTMNLMTLCSTNNCNKLDAKFSEASLVYNGVTCQNCMAADSNCETSERRQCTGNENYCFLQISDLTGMASAKSAVRGCVTKNICDLGTQTYNALGIGTKVNYVCSSGNKHFLMSYFTPLILCTLSLKYLF
ncbi:uncharacterized protein ACMZJ9_018996 [Mantella aurantiaca]